MEDGEKARNIEIYLRLRPVARPTDQVQNLDDDEDGKVQILLPKDAATG